jgi:hypothetical protein
VVAVPSRKASQIFRQGSSFKTGRDLRRSPKWKGADRNQERENQSSSSPELRMDVLHRNLDSNTQGQK